MNNLKLIDQFLKDHIQSSVEHFADDISTPQTYFFLSMLFLQSVGFMEQKISCILWEIGYREHLERFRIFDDFRAESLEYQTLNKLYKRLQLESKKEKEDLCFAITPRMLEDIERIIKYSLSLFEELEYNFFVLKKELNQNNKSEKKESIGQIKILTEQRNFLAHFKSFYPDKSIISFCAKNESNKNIKFEDLILYLAILIKLDEIFMEAFECYRNDYENS